MKQSVRKPMQLTLKTRGGTECTIEMCMRYTIVEVYEDHKDRIIEFYNALSKERAQRDPVSADPENDALWSRR